MLFIDPVLQEKKTFATRLQDKVTRAAVMVLDSKPVQDQWIGWLDRAFQNTKTHDALLFLLINGITDKRFVDHSVTYGLDLITDVVR